MDFGSPAEREAAHPAGAPRGGKAGRTARRCTSPPTRCAATRSITGRHLQCRHSSCSSCSPACRRSTTADSATVMNAHLKQTPPRLAKVRPGGRGLAERWKLSVARGAWRNSRTSGRRRPARCAAVPTAYMLCRRQATSPPRSGRRRRLEVAELSAFRGRIARGAGITRNCSATSRAVCGPLVPGILQAPLHDRFHLARHDQPRPDLRQPRRGLLQVGVHHRGAVAC